MNGWIMLHRSLVDWEWFRDSKTLHVFLFLLVDANHETGNWRGVVVDRGQTITGRKAISRATGLSEQSVRTALSNLKSTSEITIKSTNKYSLITICNYSTYQSEKNGINQQISQRATINQPQTISKERSKPCATKSHDENFESFWTAFEDKRGKKQAMIVWKKIHPDDALAKIIILGATSYAKARHSMLRQNKTPKMAQGWLSDERWSDEISDTTRPEKMTRQEAQNIYGT